MARVRVKHRELYHRVERIGNQAPRDMPLNSRGDPTACLGQFGWRGGDGEGECGYKKTKRPGHHKASKKELSSGGKTNSLGLLGRYS